VALTTFATPQPLPAKHTATIRTANSTNGGAAEHRARNFAQAAAWLNLASSRPRMTRIPTAHLEAPC
jgi:hypothetical protein